MANSLDIRRLILNLTSCRHLGIAELGTHISPEKADAEEDVFGTRSTRLSEHVSKPCRKWGSRST
jgi:hypothetical protein